MDLNWISEPWYEVHPVQELRQSVVAPDFHCPLLARWRNLLASTLRSRDWLVRRTPHSNIGGTGLYFLCLAWHNPMARAATVIDGELRPVQVLMGSKPSKMRSRDVIRVVQRVSPSPHYRPFSSLKDGIEMSMISLAFSLHEICTRPLWLEYKIQLARYDPVPIEMILTLMWSVRTVK